MPYAIQAKVSWYGQAVCSGRVYCKTANGENFDDRKFTTACWNEIPFGTSFHIEFNGNDVTVTCNDRGNFKRLGRYLDLSKAAFAKLAPLSKGLINVRIIKSEYGR